LPVRLEQVTAGIVFDRIQSLSRAHGLTSYDARLSGPGTGEPFATGKLG
jgi:hypothetical protein